MSNSLSIEEKLYDYIFAAPQQKLPEKMKAKTVAASSGYIGRNYFRYDAAAGRDCVWFCAVLAIEACLYVDWHFQKSRPLRKQLWLMGC